MGIIKDLRRYISVFVSNDTANAIPVNVVNQLDLTTIENLLTQIKDSTAAIDANTDQVEAKLDTIILEVQNNGTTNHADLLQVISELQSIDANTDGLEAQLTSIITNTSDNATETTLLGIKGKTDQLTFTGTDLNVNASIDPTGLATSDNQTNGNQKTQIVDAGGEVATVTGGKLDVNATFTGTVTPSPVQFVKDTIDTEVEIDTTTPANNEPLPVALYNAKGLQGTNVNPLNSAIFDASTGARAIVDQNGAIKLGEAIILSGDVLFGQNLSPFLWYDLSVNGGATFGAAGEQRLETGTTADGEIILQSRKKSRFMISQFNISHFGIQLDPAGNLSDPNTITEFGNVSFLDDAGNLNTSANGIFFRVQGDPVTPIWSIVSIKNGVENETPLASWNGSQKDNFNTSPNLSVYEIQYNAGTAIFFQGSNFVHRLAGLTSTYAATYNFPVALRIRNINGNTTNRSFGSRAAGAYRLGEERGELLSRAVTVDTLFKTGAGYVGKASLSRTGSSGGSGNAMIYDGIDATGVLIGRIDVGGDDVKGITLDGTFSNGLFVTIAGSGTNTVTLNFE